MSRLLIFVILFFPIISFALCESPVPNEYIIQTSRPDQLFSESQLQKTNTNARMIYSHLQNRTFSKTKIQKSLTPLTHSTVLATLNSNEVSLLKQNPSVLSVEQDCYVKLGSAETIPDTYLEILEPNDHLFEDQLWAYEVSNSLVLPPEPHETTIVAVSDTGFDTEHPEFVERLWQNDVEVNGQAHIDDDSNNCTDDIYGCDLTTGTGDVGLNFFRSTYIDHGTHVAGIIGAAQNNHRGVYGSASKVKMMLLKGFSSQRATRSSDLIKTVYYAVDNGAHIINCSWGVLSTPSMAEYSAFEYARQNNVLAIVAAGNESIFASKASPAGLTNVLTIGSINSKKELSTFSNYGKSVDVYAPGGDKTRRNEFILSTVSQGRYSQKRGTSMAAPFVAGVLANIKSAYPQASRNELMNLLFLSSENKTLKAYFEPAYSEEGRILNTAELYLIAKEYFESTERSLDYEPKELREPSGSAVFPSHSDYEYGYELKGGSGCARSAHIAETAQSPSLFLFFILMPVLFLLYLNRR